MSAVRPLSRAQRTLAQRVIRSATLARDKPAGRAPWRPQRPRASRAPLLGLGDGGGVDRSLGLRQTGSVATAITSPAKNALMQKEEQDIVHFGHGIPLFELRNATVARRRRSCNHLP